MRRTNNKSKYSIGSLLLLLAFFLYFACNDGQLPFPDTIEQTKEQAVSSGNFVAEVISLSDGDTFKILYKGKTEKVRLLDIDCPENSQPYGEVAKEFVKDLCLDKKVLIKPQEKRDQYGRILAYVFVDDTLNINAALVKAGLAWNYKYSKNKEFKALQREARKDRKGLWADDNPVNPWKWRKQHHR